MEVVEAADPVERVAEDQQRPSLADHLERAGERAILGWVVLAEHAVSIASSGSLIEPICYSHMSSIIELVVTNGRSPPAMNAIAGISVRRSARAGRTLSEPAAYALSAAIIGLLHVLSG